MYDICNGSKRYIFKNPATTRAEEEFISGHCCVPRYEAL